MAYVFSPDAFRRTRNVVLEYERTRGKKSIEARRGRAPSPRGPIRAILLDDCPSEGVVDAVVTVAVESPEIQRLVIEGEPTGGTFTLTFDGHTTDDLAWDATADQVQEALEALESIGAGGVVVTLGKSTDHNPGVWLIEFSGRLASENVDLIGVTSSISGVTYTITAETIWADSGRIAEVRAAIPLGTPTPLRRGAVVFAQWFPQAGYCIHAAEARLFDPYDS